MKIKNFLSIIVLLLISSVVSLMANPFKFKKNIQLMPFVSLHLGLEGLKNSWADCGIVFKTFPRYSDSQEQNLLQACNIDFNIFTAKAGFRYAYLKPQLYLDIGVNVLLFTMLFFGNSGNSE